MATPQFKTGVVIGGDGAGGVRAFKTVGEAADAYNRKVAAGTKGSSLFRQEQDRLTGGLKQLAGAFGVGDDFAQLGGFAKGAAGDLGLLRGGLTLAGGAVGVMAGIVVAGAYAARGAYKDQKQYNEAIQQTGNYAGVTRDELEGLVTSVSGGNAAKLGASRDILTGLIKTGGFTEDSLGSVATAVSAFADASGQDATAVLGDFASMRSGVAQWAKTHNESYHFLDLAQYQHIAQLEKEGRTQDAMRLTSEALTTSLNHNKVELGEWAKTGQSAIKIISAAWADAKNLFSEPLLAEQIERQEAIIARGRARQSSAGGAGGSGQSPAELELARLRAKQAQENAAAQADADQTQARDLSINLLGDLPEVNKELQKQIALFGQGQAAAKRYERDQAIGQANAVKDLKLRADLIGKINAQYAPLIANAAKLDSLANAQQSAKVNQSGLIKAQSDALIAAAASAQSLAEQAVKIDFTQGLTSYRQYYDDLARIENTAYEKTAAARQQQADAIAQEMDRLSGLGRNAPEGALQSLRAESESLRSQIEQDTAKHTQKLNEYDQARADAIKAIKVAIDPTIKVTEDYNAALLQATAAEADGKITKEQLIQYETRLQVARDASLQSVKEQLAPGAAAIKQLQDENNAIASGITLESYRNSVRLAAIGARPREIAQIQQLTKEQKLLQEVFGDASDPSAALKAGLDDLKNTVVDLSDEYGKMAAQAVSGFENIVKAAELSALATELDKKGAKGSADVRAAAQQKQLQGYAQLAAGAQGFFKEGTKGYKALGVVSQVFHAAELAASIATLIPKATAAVLTQGEGDPYSAPARMAAMAAFVAAIGVSVGGGGGGGKTSSVPKTSIGAGNGTVLGDSTAQSESIKNALSHLGDLQEKGLSIESAQLQALRSIESGIKGVGNLLYRSNAATGGPTPFDYTGSNKLSGAASTAAFLEMNLDPALIALRLGDKLNDALGGLFDKLSGGLFSGITDLGSDLVNKVAGSLLGTVKKKQIDQGIVIEAGQTLGQILSDGLDASYFATIQTTKKNFLGKHKSDKDVFADLDGGLGDQFAQIITGIGGSVLLAAESFGKDGAAAKTLLDNFQLDIGKISLEGLKPEEVQDRVAAVFSALGDTLAEQLVPEIGEFQQVGEGLYETLVRVTSETAAVVDIMDGLGNSFGQSVAGIDQARVAEHLIDLAGGIDNFASNVTNFIDKFTDDGEKAARLENQLADSLASVGLAIPPTAAALRDVVRGLDLTSDSGAKTFNVLTSLSDGLDSYYARLKEQADFLNGIQTQIAGAGLSGESLDVFNLDQQFNEMRAQATDLGVSLESIEELYGIRRAAIAKQYADAAEKAAADAAEKEAQERDRLNAEAQRAAEQAAAARAAEQERLQQAFEEAQKAAEAFRDSIYDVKLSLSQTLVGLSGGSVAAFDRTALVNKINATTTAEGALALIGPLKEALEGEFNEAVSAVEDSRKTQIDAINATRDATLESLEAQRDVIKDQVSDVKRLKDLAAGLRDYVRGLNVDSRFGDSQTTLTAAQANFDRLVTLAQGNDQDALGNLAGAADKLLDIGTDSVGTYQELQQLRASISGVFSNLAGSLEALPSQEDLLTSIDASIESLKTSAQAQIDAVNAASDAQIAALKTAFAANVTVLLNAVTKLEAAGNAASSSQVNSITSSLTSNITPLTAQATQANTNLNTGLIATGTGVRASLATNNSNVSSLVGTTNSSLSSVNSSVGSSNTTLTGIKGDTGPTLTATNSQSTQLQKLGWYNSKNLVTEGLFRIENAQYYLLSALGKIALAVDPTMGSPIAYTERDVYRAFIEGAGLSAIASSVSYAALPATPSALGNVFSGGLVPFANGGAFTNTLVNDPTYFNMGLMGEAGPEAIMPLERMSGGQLGVHARISGGGGSIDIRPLIQELRSLLAELRALRTNNSAENVAIVKRLTAISGVLTGADAGGALKVLGVA